MVALARRPVPLTWAPRDVRGRFFSSADGRFDLFYSDAAGDWVAIDAEQGQKYRGQAALCELWCAEMAAEFPSLTTEG
jgi:hypothetical protein